MLIRHPSDIPSSEITPEDIYRNRREFMRGALGIAALGLTQGARSAPAYVTRDSGGGPQWLAEKIGTANPDSEKTQEPLTPYQHVTTYNNFYEFGYDKSDPAKHAGEFQPHPWQVEIAGAVNKPGVYHLEDLLKGLALEERVYRLRCVEAWSMVIPWIGFSLAELLKRFEPTSAARYVAFTTLVRPEEMPAQKKHLGTIEWPYREGLRLDEALHPLSLVAVGLYGKVLPNQNGAPLRLVVPWKYGFKSIKSIVKIELTEHQPYTSWSAIAPKEYGFYANVNPQVDHPRWSQAQERRLPGGLLKPNILPTQLFNGYGDQVAHMYRDMDLRKYY